MLFSAGLIPEAQTIDAFQYIVYVLIEHVRSQQATIADIVMINIIAVSAIVALLLIVFILVDEDTLLLKLFFRKL